MKIFLVRHGEGILAKDRWQSPDTPLSKLGERQAEALVNLSRLKIVDIILTSKWSRSKRTAEIIASSLDKPLEIIEGIHERKQHPKIYGASRVSNISKKYYKEFSDNFKDLDWRFEDVEESLRDVIKRVINFKKHLLKKHLDQNLLVVSHDIFIRCFITVCLLGEKYQDKVFKKIFYSLRIGNASVSLLEYDKKRKYWKLWYLNDFSHLKFPKK